MEINEVKIGDTVSFMYKKKKITGTVIHRHDGTKNAALSGHVNVRPMDADARPHTLHVSKIKPANKIKEDIQMEKNINEAISDLIDNIEAGNHVEANNIFNDLLQTKIDALLDAKKIEVSSAMFNTENCADCDEELEEAKKMKKEMEDEDDEDEDEEELDEALKGNQHKIDANKNGKIDAHDFKMLRKKKGMKENAEVLGEEEYDYYRDYKHGGATYDEYKSAVRNFQNTQKKYYRPKPKAPEVKEPHSVHINGKKWKSFSSHGHASNVAKKLAAKGGSKKFTVHKD